MDSTASLRLTQIQSFDCADKRRGPPTLRGLAEGEKHLEKTHNGDQDAQPGGYAPDAFAYGTFETWYAGEISDSETRYNPSYVSRHINAWKEAE